MTADSAVRAVAYRGQLKNVGGNLVYFFLPEDYATSFARRRTKGQSGRRTKGQLA
jgi:hypothetical protein